MGASVVSVFCNYQHYVWRAFAFNTVKSAVFHPFTKDIVPV